MYKHIETARMNVNPMERKVIKRALAIDTLYRKHYDRTSSTDFIYTLPEPLNKVLSMKVSAIEFPNSWYAFTNEDHSNEFTITLYNTPTPNDLAETYPDVIENVIIIPDGNYRSDVFITAINNMFTNMRNGLEYIYLQLNEIDARVYFRTKTIGDDIRNTYLNVDIPSNFYFTVDFRPRADPDRPLYKNAGWMMGFRKPFYTVEYRDPPIYSAIDTAYNINQYNWFLASESCYGSSVSNYVFLEIDDFNRNFTTNTFNSTTMNDAYLGNNIMARITVSSGMNTVVINNAGDRVFREREYFGPVRLEKLHIRLLNKHGEPILLNGNDYSFMLEFDILYS